MDSKPAIKNFSWSELHALSKTIALQIKNNVGNVDVVIGITRGGCFPALTLSYLLSVRSVLTIQISTTVDEKPRAARISPIVTTSLPEAGLVRGKVCLLVDDVTNTGATMLKARRELELYEPSRIVTATLVWDTVPAPDNMPIETCHADYVATQIHAWASFPWEEIQ